MCPPLENSPRTLIPQIPSQLQYCYSYGMDAFRSGMRRAMHSLPSMVFLVALGALSPSYADEAAAREKVKAAFATDAKEPQATYEAARQAVTDPNFGALETGTQHAALVLAYTAAYQAKDFDRTHEFA